MIWVFLVLLTLLTIGLVWPILSKGSRTARVVHVDREIEACQNQLDQMEAEVGASRLEPEDVERTRLALERRMLALAERKEALTSEDSTLKAPQWARLGVPALMGIGTLGIYAVVGAPFYTPLTEAEARAQATPEIPEAFQNMSLEELAEVLEARLENEPNPVGYVLLARTYIGLSDLDNAIIAYERALETSNGDANVADELAQARQLRQDLSARPPALDPEQMEAFSEMSPEDQAGMINTMVDQLATRLNDDPNDLGGWLRLIRARAVLGQTEQTAADLATARATFSEDPEALARLNLLAADIEAGLAE